MSDMERKTWLVTEFATREVGQPIVWAEHSREEVEVLGYLPLGVIVRREAGWPEVIGYGPGENTYEGTILPKRSRLIIDPKGGPR